MMAPTVVAMPDERRIALGSGGSNRIRSAILQVIVNLLDFGAPLERAVEAPRIHLEDDTLNLETGFDESVLEELRAPFPRQRIWPATNLFFGGAHSVQLDGAGHCSGQGDSRRGGVCLLA